MFYGFLLLPEEVDRGQNPLNRTLRWLQFACACGVPLAAALAIRASLKAERGETLLSRALIALLGLRRQAEELRRQGDVAELLRDRLGSEKAIVFTYYADTAAWIEQAITADPARFGSEEFRGAGPALGAQRLSLRRGPCLARSRGSWEQRGSGPSSGDVGAPQ